MNKGAMGIALVLLAVGLWQRGPSILQHQAWAGGGETTQGHIDRQVQSIVKYRHYYTVGYSYKVAGKSYSNEYFGVRDFGGTGPVEVTYARNDPSVSTLEPDKIDSVFKVSVAVVAVLMLPPMIVLFLGLRKRKPMAADQPE